MNHYTITRFCSRTLPAVFLGCLLFSYQPAVAEDSLRTIRISMGDYAFTPDTITVKAGETVNLTFSNTDNITPHNFILRDDAAGLNVDIDVSAQESGSVEITPTTPGRYTFYCDKKLLFFKGHRERGMEGTLIVTPAGTP